MLIRVSLFLLLISIFACKESEVGSPSSSLPIVDTPPSLDGDEDDAPNPLEVRLLGKKQLTIGDETFDLSTNNLVVEGAEIDRTVAYLGVKAPSGSSVSISHIDPVEQSNWDISLILDEFGPLYVGESLSADESVYRLRIRWAKGIAYEDKRQANLHWGRSVPLNISINSGGRHYSRRIEYAFGSPCVKGQVATCVKGIELVGPDVRLLDDSSEEIVEHYSFGQTGGDNPVVVKSSLAMPEPEAEVFNESLLRVRLGPYESVMVEASTNLVKYIVDSSTRGSVTLYGGHSLATSRCGNIVTTTVGSHYWIKYIGFTGEHDGTAHFALYRGPYGPPAVTPTVNEQVCSGGGTFLGNVSYTQLEDVGLELNEWDSYGYILRLKNAIHPCSRCTDIEYIRLTR